MYYSVIDTYTTMASDTIHRIACRFYYHWWLWKIIYDFNKEVLGGDPYAIPAGVAIKIINLNTEPITHTIRSGETWNRLSSDYYGTERHFVDIAIANDWKHLIAGETCVIPALVSKKNINLAKELRNACS